MEKSASRFHSDVRRTYWQVELIGFDETFCALVEEIASLDLSPCSKSVKTPSTRPKTRSRIRLYSAASCNGSNRNGITLTERAPRIASYAKVFKEWRTNAKPATTESYITAKNVDHNNVTSVEQLMYNILSD